MSKLCKKWFTFMMRRLKVEYHFKEISKTGLKVHLQGEVYENAIKHFTKDRFFECSQSSRRDLSAT